MPPAPRALQAAALRSLGRFLLLSECCGGHLPAVERCLRAQQGDADGSSAPPEVAAAAVAVLADTAHQFPNLHGARLLQIGALALETGPAPGGSGSGGPDPEQAPEAVRHAAAAAYTRLLLSGRFKLQGALGPAGAAIVGADPKASTALAGSLCDAALGDCNPCCCCCFGLSSSKHEA